MTLNAHLLHPPDPVHLSFLQAQLVDTATLTTGPEIPAETTLLVAGRPTPEHLATCPALHTLIIPFAGLPGTTRDLLRQHPHISVHNLHHNAIPTAEMALTLLLAAAKFVLPADRDLRQGNWAMRYEPNPAVLLDEKRVVVLGYGAIGQHTARLCRGVGMKVWGVKRRIIPGEEFPDTVFSVEALLSLLPQADALMITLPLTDETRGLLGAAELALLPPHAVLVNVGRAEVVDEAALFHALQSKQLHAAGLDVWYRYPADTATRTATQPSTYPFHMLDNVVLSPHRAGGGGADEIEQRRMTSLAELLNAAARGLPLSNRIDLAAGY